MLDESTTLARLSAAYPAWHIWRSQAGRWWATRLGVDTPWGGGSSEGGSFGGGSFATTIDADTLDGLAKELACL